MMDRSKKNPMDPTGWTYQANIHGLLRPPATLPEGWQTCKHNRGDFVNWHRMFLYYFEQVLRKASGSPTLALFYWDYSDPSQRAVPAAFRAAHDPESAKPGTTMANPLYLENRGQGINAGAELHDEATQAELSLAAPTFSDQVTIGRRIYPGFGGVPDAGGCLEDVPHNFVHDQVGGLMGNPASAGNDPIFWFHHCNVDRLWSVWTNAGHQNPTGDGWADQPWLFFDGDGKKVTQTFAQWLRDHGPEVVYDDEAPRVASAAPPPGAPAPDDAGVAPVEPPPAPDAPPPEVDTAQVAPAAPRAKDIGAQMTMALTNGTPMDDALTDGPAPKGGQRAAVQTGAKVVLAADTVAAQTAAPLALGPAPAVRTLNAAPAPTGGASTSRSTRAFVTSTKKKDDRVILRVSDLSADSAPGATFTIFVNLPPGTDPKSAPAEFRVGSVSFFDSVAQSKMAGMDMPKRKPLEFDITDLVRAQVASKHWNDDAVVTIVGQGAVLPNGERVKASASANAAVGKLEIVHQTK